MSDDVAYTARPRRRSALRWGLLALLVVLVCVFGYAGTLGLTAWNVSHRIYHALPTDTPQLAALGTPNAPTPAPATPAIGTPTWTPSADLAGLPTLPPGETWDAPPTADPSAPLPAGRINILLLGTDKRTGEDVAGSRSDTLIVLSVDPQWKTAGILSIPRDLLVSLPGLSKYGLQKINGAYFFGEYDKLPGGGPALAVQTVHSFFQVPIQYYVALNFGGFRQIVDEVGGIDVYIPEPIDDPEYPGPANSFIHVTFAAGCQHLDGLRALQYARTRHADSDFARNHRQQQVIRAVRDKALQLNMLPQFQQLLNTLGDTIETNIPPDQQFALAQLGTQIKSDGLYTAQIDSTMVRNVGGTGGFVLRWDKARPMLDWFFGRGAYASLRPGTVLTPAATPSAIAALLSPLSGETALPAGEATQSAEGIVSPVAASPTPPPPGQCR